RGSREFRRGDRRLSAGTRLCRRATHRRALRSRSAGDPARLHATGRHRSGQGTAAAHRRAAGGCCHDAALGLSMRAEVNETDYVVPSRLTWAVLSATVAVLVIPSYVDVYRVYWRVERGAQGAVILAAIVWLIWRERGALRRFDARSPLLPGLALLIPGIALYVLGRSQSIYTLEIVAQIPVMLGIASLLWG